MHSLLLGRHRRAMGQGIWRRRLLAGAVLVLVLLAPTAARADEAAATAPQRPSVTTTRVHHVPAATLPVAPPHDLGDLAAWLDYRVRNHIVALPFEARFFYRNGLLLHQSGSHEAAVRALRGAAELDPTFIAPHLTLGSWLLTREPSQALLQYATVIELARDDFLFQLALAGNALHLLLLALFWGFLGAALILVGLHHLELRHICVERVARLASPTTARWWVWAIVILPFAVGLGLAVPALVLLALLYPSLRVQERLIMVGLLGSLVVMPWALGALDRLGAPLRADQPPFHGVALLPAEAPRQDGAAQAAALAAGHPDNAFVQFAAAWTARRQNDLGAAEAAYRRALELWPQDDRVLNNLGNVLAMQGRTDEALELYRRAARVNPNNAAPLFNASQIYTQRFDYRAATEAVSRASALNFDLVKSYQSQATDDGVLPLADVWIAPRAFWSGVSLRPTSAPARAALPAAWRSRVEASGWGFTLAAAVLTLLALILGSRLHRALPLRACSNCGAVICRRCARRRRETALCPACAAAEASAEAPDFARVLLLRHRREVRATQRHLHDVVALLVPGYGLLRYRRAASALLLLCATGAMLAVTLGEATPFPYESRPTLSAHALPLPVLAGAWLAIYAISFLGYLAQRARVDAEEAAAAAPVRSRIRLTNRDRTSLAA